MENIIKYFSDNFAPLSQEQINQLRENLDNEKDFYLELETGEEFRLIDEKFIDDIFEDSVIQLVEDCYFTKDNEFLQRYFDYDKFVQDCKMDGFWTHFNSYDWSEEFFDWYYIFRIN